jgi:hypothetical protein
MDILTTGDVQFLLFRTENIHPAELSTLYYRCSTTCRTTGSFASVIQLT